MRALIDDLLAFAKLGKQELRKTSIDMNELVQTVISDLRQALSDRTQISVEPLHPGTGVYALVRQVFVNLISNAIKYSAKKEQPQIWIKSEMLDREVAYSVEDNGEGFDMKYADRLFAVFQRLHSEAEFEGTGIGLATVQRIIHKHGGKIKAEAEKGKGAKFRFTLPREA